MSKIIWDEVGSRVYESGLDRGVLYLPDGTSVPWNGLTAVVEKFNRSVNSVYFDGAKINDIVTLGDFSATLKAVTYPEEFHVCEGSGELREGAYIGEQKPQSFALTYRTRVGDDVEGSEAGYKIHILYNVTATPSDKTYSSASSDPSLVEFEWSIYATPEPVDGHRPSSHIVIDTRHLDPWLIEEIEEYLYGTSSANASLLPIGDMASYLANWARIRITDNGDGTWTATSTREGFIFLYLDDQFLIDSANVVFLDDVTYILSDTNSTDDTPAISVVPALDGTFIISTTHDNIIVVVGDPANGIYDIHNATVSVVDADTYDITDTFY